jgi:hypothetical protein
MILELSPDEMVIFNSLTASELSDYAVLAQMLDICGITTKVFKNSYAVEAIEGCVAS